MSLDQIHLGVTFFLWVVGLVLILATAPKVSPIRRISYWLATPVWAGWVVVYAFAFLSYVPSDSLEWNGIAVRLLLFAIALEGILVPMTDRLELRIPTEIRVEVEEGEAE